jgi:two-component system, chemotaxis family, sensor kinase Cph1
MQPQQDYRQLYSSMLEAFDVLNLNYFVMEIICNENGVPVDGIYRQVSPATVKLIGKSQEEIIGKSRRELFGNMNDEFPAEFYEVLKTGQPKQFQSHGAALNKHYDVYAWKVADRQVAALIRDITGHKKAQDELKISEERFSKAFNASPAAVSISRLSDGLLIDINRAYTEVFGFTSEEAIGETSIELGIFVDPNDRSKVVSQLRESGKVRNLEVNFKTKTGKFITTLTSLDCIKIGGVDYMLSTVLDITERKKAEEALENRTTQLEQTQKKLEEKADEVEEYAARMQELVRERTERLELSANYARELIETSLDPLVTISSEGKITDVNKATEIVTGCGREELIGSNFSYYFTEPERAEAGYKKVLTEGYVRDYPLAIKSNAGEIVEVLYNAAIYYDKTGNPQGVFAAARDITERKKLETQLQEKDRLAAIGATAGMVGHDIRNPLQSIIGDIYLAKAELEGLPNSQAKRDILESLVSTESNVDYINKIVQDLQDYARPLNPKCEETDLQAVFKRVVVQSRLPQNIKACVQVEPQQRTISTDPYYLNRILYNLITNSVQAMPNGGELTIKAYREAENTVITVKDTGAGILKDVQPKMFTVMFTTKSKGQGFGLPVVKRMTESLGGSVSFESKEGKGTTFILKLPDKA